MEGKGEEDAAENVVRFPRDWVGPLEDLVPIGSRARARPGTDEGREDGPAPIAADDFWSESASAVHDAIQGPAVEPTPVRRVPDRRLAALRGRLPDWRPGLRWPVIAAAAVVIAVIAVATIGLTEGPSSSGPQATTTQDASVGGSAAPSHSSAGKQITHHPAHRSQTPHAHAKTQPKTAKHTTRHRAPARHAHHALRAHHPRTQAAPRHAQRVRHRNTAPIVQQTTTVTVQASPSTTVAPAVTSSPPPVESTPPSAPAATSASSSGGSSSAGPPGPTGYGSAVGCNPKCS